MVVIKNFKMPSCCNECVALSVRGDNWYCNLTGTCKDYKFKTKEKIMNTCPLEEIEPEDVYEPITHFFQD